MRSRRKCARRTRGEQLGLTEHELAFYDALETNDSTVKVLGDETLRGIARELVAKVRKNVTIDWTLRENVRALCECSLPPLAESGGCQRCSACCLRPRV